MKIRSAVRADLPAIVDIYNYAVLHTTATADYEPQAVEEREKWFDDREKQGYPVVVAEVEDGVTAGWGSLSAFKSRVGYRFSAENSIYVSKNHQGKGVGKALLAELIARARSMGLHAIIAVIDADNQPSIHLHSAQGFAHCGRMREVYQKFGRWLDVAHMVRLLE